MRVIGRIARCANSLLETFGLQVVRGDRASREREKPWDDEFKQWIAEAERTGRDPNDLGDSAWGGSALPDTEKYILPHVRPDSVVLELGPGSGRVTRHVIGRCGEMILVDYSRFVCEWMTKYFDGKGKFKTLLINTPSLEGVATESVDLIFAEGVFHHIELDDLCFFLEEFHRVLKPRGVMIFNFVNIMSSKGKDWFRQWRPPRGGRSIFRFYHPDVVRDLAEMVGFETLRLAAGSQSLLATIEARRPASRA